jgi:hypothetical protein
MIRPTRPIQLARRLAESGLAAKIVITHTLDFATLGFIH